MIAEIITTAESLEKQKLWKEASLKYIEANAINQKSQYQEKIAWCLSMNCDYDESLKWLFLLEQTIPNDKKILYMIGYQFYCKKDWKNSVKYFDEALKIYKEYFIVKYRNAYALLQLTGTKNQWTMAEFWKAISHFDECHVIWNKFSDYDKEKNRSTYFDINFLHGKILMDLPNKRNEAINYFKSALEIKADLDTSYNLAKTYYLSGEYELAAESLVVSEKYYTMELDAYIKVKLKKYDEAISQLNTLLKFRKKDYLYTELAEAYLFKKDFYTAYKYSQIAISIGKNNHKNYYMIANILNNFGLLNEAIKNLKIANEKKKVNFGGDYSDALGLIEKINNSINENYHEDIDLLNKLNDNHCKNKDSLSGEIIKYNDIKGFGFIKYNNESIFFHISNCIFKSPCVGQKVNFKVQETNKGKSAIDINNK